MKKRWRLPPSPLPSFSLQRQQKGKKNEWRENLRRSFHSPFEACGFRGADDAATQTHTQTRRDFVPAGLSARFVGFPLRKNGSLGKKRATLSERRLSRERLFFGHTKWAISIQGRPPPILRARSSASPTETTANAVAENCPCVSAASVHTRWGVAASALQFPCPAELSSSLSVVRARLGRDEKRQLRSLAQRRKCAVIWPFGPCILALAHEWP